jgi:hypothetical protein
MTFVVLVVVLAVYFAGLGIIFQLNIDNLTDLLLDLLIIDRETNFDSIVNVPGHEIG